MLFRERRNKMTALARVVPAEPNDEHTQSFGLQFSEGMCEDCRHWANPFFDGELGICDDEMSDHYSHVTAHNHPFCRMAKAKREQAETMKRAD